jgi:hypothetical protein
MNTLTTLDPNTTAVNISLKLSLEDLKQAIGLLFRSFGNSVTVGDQEMLDVVVDKTKEWWASGVAIQEQKDLIEASETVANQAKQDFINNTTTISSKIKI